MTLREQFEKETKQLFDCNKCKYIKGEDCCPEENDCIIEKNYKKWLEDRCNKHENAKEIITNKNGMFIRDEKHRKMIDELRKKIKQLEECLEWYADNISFGYIDRMYDDNGQKARDCLNMKIKYYVSNKWIAGEIKFACKQVNKKEFEKMIKNRNRINERH